MTIEKNELLFIYNSTNHLEKEALAYIKALKHYQKREIDLAYENLTPTQTKFIADQCDLSLVELLDEKHQDYSATELKALDEKGLLNYIQNHSDLLNTPLVLWHEGGKKLTNKFEIVSEDLKLNDKRAEILHENN